MRHILHFMQDEKFISRIEKLKESVKHLLYETKDIIHQLKLIDTLSQLGVAHHFVREIKDAFGTIYSVMNININILKDDLYSTSLLFRLLREHGFKVSQGVFDEFKDENGNFQLSLSNDIKGMLSLYEASYLAMEGEDALDKARVFTTKHLKGIIEEDDIDHILKEHIKHALELPMHWRMPRLHTHWFIGIYEKDDNMNPVLLEFAKLDFNILQNTHRKEIKQCSRWWSTLNLLDDDLSFSRDRLVENYLFAMGWVSKAKFSFYRETLTQVNCLVTIIDDIYDTYGSIHELELFTSIVDRWDVNDIDYLPKFMKICFLGLFNTTNDTAYKALKMRNVNCIPYLKKLWLELCIAYLVEAKWAHSDYNPTLKEYLDNAWISIGAFPILFHSFFCISEATSNEALDILEKFPIIMRQSFLIARLCNDLATSAEEVNRGDLNKSIQCYMHEKGVAETIAREHIQDLIRETWKELNTKIFTMSSPFDVSLNNLAMNIAHTGHFMYDHGDGFGIPQHKTKDRVISLVIKPIPLDEM
ncbi:(-)-alpha-terpineol synthase protein [Dioscorea alata]|uniref:(-)-alpha-terpineol synthase protein n=1 Tax=Dioscorea alata TaxID=55571 RepID=A0ACB7UZ69_DIOAL|nr:(-)-alpha-terpineol synthase protein [Dioscorea alata]